MCRIMYHVGSLLPQATYAKMPLIECLDQVTTAWLSEVLGEKVDTIEVSTSSSTWAQNASISASLADGSHRSLRLKLCLGTTFGRSEVDYYTQDYTGLVDAPLVPCYDACYEAGVGYHVLLEDLSFGFQDRKHSPPTLPHGLAIAAALARLQNHHWESASPPTVEDWERYFDQIRPGIEPIEQETGREFHTKFEFHAKELVLRWSKPVGLTLLHGDINPTNVLTPKGLESPVYFLDRQPFEWAITYGLTVYDLAYAIVPWWPHEFRIRHQGEILRHWLDHLDHPGYSWEQAQYDWDLSVEHCLHVPIEWCRDTSDLERMRPLWEWQLGNITGMSLNQMG